MPSKLSVQAKYPFITSYDFENLANSYFNSLMFLENPTAAEEAWKRNPKRIYVHRRVGFSGKSLESHLDIENGLSNPAALAQKWFNLMLPDLKAAPHAYHQIVNEYNNQNRLVAFGEFEIECMKLANAIGVKLLHGNFADGNPSDMSKFATYLFVLQYSAKTGNAFGLHEYNGKSLYNAPTLEYNLFRHRILDKLYGLSAIQGLMLIISEMGIANIEGTGTNGWKTCQNKDQYLASLKQYSDDIEKDSYLKAAFIYLLSHQVDSGDGRTTELTQNFDVTEVLPGLLTFAKDRNSGVQLPLPTLTPAPVPTPTGKFKITTSGLRLRSGPGLSYSTLLTLTPESVFTVDTPNPPLGIADNWVQVSAQTSKGWCWSAYIQNA